MAALRRGELDTPARRRYGGSLAAAADAYYYGIWAAFYTRWHGGRATMRDSGWVLKKVEREARKVRRMLALAEFPWAAAASAVAGSAAAASAAAAPS